MADFTLAQIGEASGGGPSSTSGVQEPSAVASFANLATSAAQGLFGAMQQTQQAEQQTQINKSVQRFSEQQMKFAQWVDEGVLSSQEARMRMRQNLIKAGADNPNLAEEFTKAHTSVITTSGMGKVAAEGTEQEQAFFATQQAATEAGWVLPGMSSAQAQEATMDYMQFNREQEVIKDRAARIGLQRAQMGLQTDRIRQNTAGITNQTAQITLSNKVEERQAQRALASMSQPVMNRLNNISQSIQSQVEAGEISAVEATQMLDEEWQQIEATAMSMGGQAGSEYVSNLVTPMRNLYQLRRGYLTGETPKEVLEQQVGLEMARQGAMVASDPDNATILGISKIIGEGNPALVAAMNGVANRALEQNSGKEGRAFDITDPGNRSGTLPYISALSNAQDRVVDGSAQEGTEDEVKVNVNNILKSVGQNGSSVESPTELNDAVNYFSSDSYGKYVEKNGTGINSQYEGSARTVVQGFFEAEVRPLIAEEWRNATTQTRRETFGPGPGGTDAGQTASTEVIKPFFSGGSLRFVATDAGANNPSVQRRVKELNSKVAPVVERLVKAGAHLEEHRNYQSIYESNYAGLFGDAGAGSTEE